MAFLPVRPHYANARQNRSQEDHNSFLLWRTGGDHQTPAYYMDKTIQQDLKSNNLSLNGATDVAQNRPLWRLMSMFGATHS